jgi:hypothetical protein
MASNELERCDKTVDMFAPTTALGREVRMFRAKFKDGTERWIFALGFEGANDTASDLGDVKNVFEAYQDGQVCHV